jgi:hypothetical protein
MRRSLKVVIRIIPGTQIWEVPQTGETTAIRNHLGPSRRVLAAAGEAAAAAAAAAEEEEEEAPVKALEMAQVKALSPRIEVLSTATASKLGRATYGTATAGETIGGRNDSEGSR